MKRDSFHAANTAGGGLGGPVPDAVFQTQFQCCSVEFSPFQEARLAVATAQYFGIIGNGRQHILEIGPDGNLREIRSFLTQEGLYDCCWSETNQNQLVSASADGSLKLWDVMTSDGYPVAHWQEHSAEVSSVHWNQVAKTSFLSASWDGSIKLWDPHHPTSLSTYCGHTGCVYAGIHSPRHSHRFLSCGTDGSLRIWDTKLPPSHATSLALGRVEGGAVQVVRAHEGEVLSADWDKYQDFLVYTGGVDRSIKMWDLRRPSLPLGFLHGHGYAVRRLKTSPHQEGVLGSVSYDMSCRVWGPTRVRGRAGELWRCEEHTEFVQGLDFHLFWPGRIATCGWDRRVCVWTLPFA
ncbi:hypothetical protein NSK_001684 [Nannochloropsis salina CCMP1776]|uniref:Peroxin-7 n=1 Tax=Nannochloropsis salina CCMP1776 TaxID=1027361 RepID=A0A4D9D710_9STRA|nr:hypothetical protein NSK_001684 [Nannochloropsis salina CCMP1776]|eukprot:TFJ87352.1 hypothetical protein NSK_001684 [Nannochloropsis salina CCMP1776]